ncbi:MAG: hypothetical protein AAF558_05280 [Verrucomicrobiota bacterium]
MPNINIGWERKHLNGAGRVQVASVSAPNVTFSQDNLRPGQDWFSLGAGVQMSAYEQWHCSVQWDSQLGRSRSLAHSLSLRLGYTF